MSEKIFSRIEIYDEQPNISGYYRVNVEIEFVPYKPFSSIVEEIEINQFNARLCRKAYDLAKAIRNNLEIHNSYEGGKMSEYWNGEKSVCGNCRGRGYLIVFTMTNSENQNQPVESYEEKCDDCNGTGEYRKKDSNE